MNVLVRNIIIGSVLLMGGLFILFFPPKKPAQNRNIDLERLVPDQILDWKSHTYDTKDYKDQWQSVNQLLVRTYYIESESVVVDLYLEYSSDMRRAFSFHFPEDCYRAGGNEVVSLEPLTVTLSNGKVLNAKSIFIKGSPNKREESNKLVVYWLVLEGKQIYTTFGIKIDQMLAGLLSKAREGFLVRVDIRNGIDLNKDNLQIARDTISRFINDLYNNLPETQEYDIFGDI